MDELSPPLPHSLFVDHGLIDCANGLAAGEWFSEPLDDTAGQRQIRAMPDQASTSAIGSGGQLFLGGDGRANIYAAYDNGRPVVFRVDPR